MPTAAQDITAAQRSHGSAALTLGVGGCVAGLSQRGCARVFLPRSHRPVPEAVFVNTAGGLTGGDTFESRITLEPGAALTATTQAAERIYRSAGGAAQASALVELAAGARLAWLPQETILFAGSRLTRRTEVTMAEDAELVLSEMVVMGRGAMGERDITAGLHDLRRVRRGKRLILHDAQRMHLPLCDPGGALLGRATALATVHCIAPDAEDRLGPARAALRVPESGVEAAASAWDGRLAVRLISPEPRTLRRALARCLTAIRRGPLPRVWAEEETAA